MALVLGLSVAAGAEEPLRVTLDEALARLHRQSPELLAGALRVDAARGDVRTAHLSAAVPSADEVNSATADYIRIATDKLC